MDPHIQSEWEPCLDWQEAMSCELLDESEAGCLEADADSRPSRSLCDGCRRPLRVCLCHAVPHGAPFSTSTRVAILQHPKEAQRACGTVPLLRLCLRELQVYVSGRMPPPSECDEVREIAADRQCVLVCPGRRAKTLQELCHDAGGSSLTLIFVDGRWSQVRAMLDRSPWLRQLPRAVLNPPEPSAYKFRRQPGQKLVSTLEAVAEALDVLELGGEGPRPGDGLRSIFSHMVATQCNFIPDAQDKNAEYFDAPEHATVFVPAPSGGGSRTITDADEGQPLFLCRWEERRAGGARRIVVEQRLDCSVADALAAGKAIAATRPKGKRPWILPASRVPADVSWECDFPSDCRALGAALSDVPCSLEPDLLVTVH